MATTLNFQRAKIKALSLAKVGNPLRSEPLKTSKELCHFSDDDSAVLTPSFLKPFKSLEKKSFHHHSSLNLNEVYGYAAAIFDNTGILLEQGRKIARQLYNTSKHPNIKSGDLCIALVEDVLVDGDPCLALSIIKSESRVPFLEVADSDGNLQLITHQGISPDKIDKGCLILNIDTDKGFLVYTFDKSSAGTHFWMRDFLGVKFRKDDDFMTKRYTDMCVSFAKEALPDEMEAEEKTRVANQAMTYFEEKEEFDLKHFREEALKEPDIIERFDAYQANHNEDESGEAELKEKFTIAKDIARKASNKVKSTLKLDTGVNILFTPSFKEAEEGDFERGFDEGKQKKFIKVYYENEL